MAYRHLFLSLGLGVRKYTALLRQTDAISIEKLRFAIPHSGKNGYDLASNALTAVLPFQSVGVMSDSRTCGYVTALRAVLASDFMTVDGAELPYALLKKRAAHPPRSARPSGAWRVALPAQAACDD